jgi:hypothetical protein
MKVPKGEYEIRPAAALFSVGGIASRRELKA